MSIALPSTTKRGLTGLLGRKAKTTKTGNSAAEKQLQARDIAKLFSTGGHIPKTKPATLNDNEKQDRDEMSNLRGALYSKD